MSLSLPLRLQQLLRFQRLIQDQRPLLVSVSGGADSVALLRLLLELQPRWGYGVHVLHFDHGLRPESAEELQFVEALARDHGLDFHAFRSRTLAEAKSGWQAKARAWRREVGPRVLAEIGGQAIVTAHHADDQMETWLGKWLRGAHLSQWQPMRHWQEPYLHPLLSFHKKELVAYLQQLGQDWREDASNASLKYKRNRLRHELVPLLQDLTQGALAQRLGHYAEQSAQLEDWLEATFFALEPCLPMHAWNISREELSKQARFVQNAWLHRWIRQHTGKTLDFETLQRLSAFIGQARHEGLWALGNGFRLRLQEVEVCLEQVTGEKEE